MTDEQPQEKQDIKTEGKQYFVQVPSIAKFELTPYELVLYMHYVWRGGAGRKSSWESLATTATLTGMSESKVKECRKALDKKGYIKLETRQAEHGGNITSLITVLDIWERNVLFFKDKKESQLLAIASELHRKPQNVGGFSSDPRHQKTEGGFSSDPKQYSIEQESVNTLSEASSEGVTPSEHNSSTEAEKPTKEEVAPRPANLLFEWLLLQLFGQAYDPANRPAPNTCSRVSRIECEVKHIPLEELQAFYADYKRWTRSKSNPNGLTFPKDGVKIASMYHDWKSQQEQPAPKGEFHEWMLGW